jgi:predicted DCC family thiol-disulfide oxidoreductase YuxK
VEGPDIILVYDQQCPFCHHYSKMVRIKHSGGRISLINARESHPEVEHIKAMGFDLNQGMVVKISEQYYYGADALHILALLSSRSGLLNQLNYWLFKSEGLSKLLYPLMREGRNFTLKLLGKSKIP